VTGGCLAARREIDRSQRAEVRRVVTIAAVALALLIPFLGPNVWRWPGDAMRILSVPQVVVALVLIDLRASVTRVAAAEAAT